MREFKLLLVIFSLFFAGCSPQKVSDVCPTCNMQIDDSKLHSTSLHVKSSTHNFDDIGCMVLFAKEYQIDLKRMKSKVFTNDTKRYIDSSAAHYKLDEQTPMGYGFSAYENEESNTIRFEDVIINMLRGEHMANPKIKKQALGSNS